MGGRRRPVQRRVLSFGTKLKLVTLQITRSGCSRSEQLKIGYSLTATAYKAKEQKDSSTDILIEGYNWRNAPRH